MWYQLKSILWKNWLLKKAHFAGFIAELMLPVLFMALLILIKSITTSYDSPNVAYYCGNAYPWYYNKDLSSHAPYTEQVPYTCTQKPVNCTEKNYYQHGFSIPDPDPFVGYDHGYTQYGYVESGASSGSSTNPFYTYTIADKSYIYYDAWIDNPSLPMEIILARWQARGVILAIAPRYNDPNLLAMCYTLRTYFLSLYPYAPNTVVVFTSSQSLSDYMKDKDYDDVGFGYGKVAAAVVLNGVDIANAQWDYSIRTNYTSIWDENDPTVACMYGDPYWGDCYFTYTIPTTKFYSLDLFKPQQTAFQYGYTYSGFATIQKSVDEFIFQQYHTDVKVNPSVSMMPTSPYKTDDFQYVISSTLGIFYMLSYLYPVSRIVRGLVIEKETRIKEGMKMMGLTDTVYNLSWLITTVLQMTLVSILITLVTATSVFEYSNKFYVFLYFESFSLAVICMCFLMATMFSRSKVASMLGPMIFFGSFFPYYAVSDPQFDTGSKAATCLLAPACFALGANVFADFEGGLVGVQTDNAGQTTSNFSYNLCVGMMFLDAFLYGIAAWYLDKVFPSEFGTQLPLYFPLLPSYWCGVRVCGKSSKGKASLWDEMMMCFGFSPRRRYSSISQRVDNDPDIIAARLSLETGLLDTDNADERASLTKMKLDHRAQYFEPVGADLRQQLAVEKCLSIRGLRKVFKNPAGGADSVAVHGLNLDLYQGQVTVLLGHNGAGKTTTISMLVGLIPPTAGDATMPGGLTIGEDMQTIRRNLGVCPQHDILFPELTVMQHLQIYASFKGVPAGKVKGEAERMLAEVGLAEKKNAKSSTLSGGQKRKLSLGIALIGDSKVVILDEPTSGMDPYSRRSTWNIIQRNKKGRVILLTTHFMDEADLLGDRVAIMAHGRLQCVGNPLFLKSKFGVGYTLTIVKLAQTNQHKDELQRISQRISDIVTSVVASAEPLSDVGAEQSFRLPFAASDRFVALFEALDANMDALGIGEYGISVTTLEEVFIRVGQLEGEEEPTTPGVASPPAAAAGAAAPSGAAAVRKSAGHSSTHSNFHSSSGHPDEEEVIVNLNNTSSNELNSVVGQNSRGQPVYREKQGYADDNIPLVQATKLPDRLENVFFKHFSAMFTKRWVYAKRDQRMLLCQLILPVLLVVIGLSLLLITPDGNQPDLVLSPSKYNAGLGESYRNFVPFYAEEGSTVAAAMQSRFNGDASDGVYGTAVPIDFEGENNPFAYCSVGATPLYNMSKFLLKDAPSSEKGSSRYGAATIASTTNVTELDYNIMVNGSAVHGVGIYMNLVHQAFLQVSSGIGTATITTHNHPLPRTYKQDNQTAAASAFIVALFAMIAFCFIPASFAVFVVKEREVKAKHQQVISGVSIYAYWWSTYIFDVLSYMPTAALVIAIMYAYSVDAFTKGPAASATALLFILYGPATAAMTYIISFLFVSHSTAQIVVMFYNFLTGLCLMVVSFVLTTVNSTTEISVSLRYLFRLFPSYCLGDGLTQLALCTEGTDCPKITTDGYDFSNFESPYHWDTVGGNLTFLAIETVVYFAIAVAIEYGLTFPALLSWLYKIHDPGVAPGEEDEDVVAEEERVARGDANQDVVRIVNLRKVYPANSRSGGINFSSMFSFLTGYQVPIKVAVQNLSFGIPKGECFGFLGINGAGKTTTLSILSGEFPPTAGQAYINGFSIAADQNNIRRRIGYCPQFDALLELLTVREHLELYGRIKGLEGAELEEVVSRKMDQLDLRPFENKIAGSLSGGNKRKLSVAVATIGDPSIVFLDEPSTGMDPVARRFMWKVIANMSTYDGHCSVILTTHSMEEAEALCTRIGVMVNGRLCCLGSGQHLKHRYGNGFEINVKTKLPDANIIHALSRRLVDAGVVHPGAAARTGAGGAHNNPINQFLTNKDTSGVEEGIELDALDELKIRQTELSIACATCGNPGRHQLIAPLRAGALIYEMLMNDGHVSVKAFLEWWLAEDMADTLQRFMDGEFAGRAKLLERSTAQNFRYRVKLAAHKGDAQITSSTTRSALSEVFAKFEAHKVNLCIQEYSVGQTTLEQIFNQFAAQQDNPEVAAIQAAQNVSTTRVSLT